MTGQSYYHQNRFLEALAKFEEAYDHGKASRIKDAALYWMAEAHFKGGNYAKAASYYRTLIAGYPDSRYRSASYYSLGWCLLKERLFREALSYFERVEPQYGKDPLFQDVPLKILECLYSGKEYEKLNARAQKYLAAQGNDSAAAYFHFYMAEAQYYTDNYAEAQRHYGTAIVLSKDAGLISLSKLGAGWSYLKLRKLTEARESFMSFKADYPDSKLLDEAVYALALSYFELPDYNASREIIETFDAQFGGSPLKPEALYLLAGSLYNLGEFARAADVFKRVVMACGDKERDLAQNAEYEIAHCYDRMGDEQEALLRFKALRSKYPDSVSSAGVMWWLGEYYHRHGDLRQSRRYFLSLIQDFPLNSLLADAHYALGVSYALEKRDDDAVEHFQKARDGDTRGLAGKAAFAMADIRVRENDMDAALKLYDEAVTKSPDLAGLVYPRLADAYAGLNKYAQALEWYRKSLDAVPVKDKAAIRFRMGEVLAASGRTDEAVAEYLKAGDAALSPLASRALLRAAQLCEDRRATQEAVKIYGKIIAMDAPEAKFARERIEELTH